MNALDVILLVVALVLFILAAVGLPSSRVSLGWLGAAAITLDLLLHALGVG